MQKSDTNRSQLKQALILIIVMMALMVLLGILLSTEARSATDSMEASTRGAKTTKALAAGTSPVTAGDSARTTRDERECDDELRRRAERRFLRKMDPDVIVRYTQDFELTENEKHIGHLVVSGGNLILSGKVEGTVL